MKKTAGILKFLSTLAMVLEVIGLLAVAAVVVTLLVAGNFSDLAAQSNSPITVNGGTMTPAEMDALKPIILIAMAFALASLVFTFIGTLKTRTALGECKEERPFSEKCVNAVKLSARMEIIGGLVGIVSSIVLALMASSLTVNGTSVGSTSTRLSLTFLFYALEKYLLYHIAKYGHSLETNPDKQ
ncbi:MAG: hypothetical protein IJI44_00430 [Erysipelotrichaceae bacterium]|nr:hypothetical protein [Erysipelotrichaceae bacterium]